MSDLVGNRNVGFLMTRLNFIDKSNDFGFGHTKIKFRMARLSDQSLRCALDGSWET